jgi:imidazolonepropionase-like amidohydrolase
MKLLLFLFCGLLFQSCSNRYDLVIENALVFDTKQGTSQLKTILINADTIVNVVDNSKSFQGRVVIHANGKLVVPGFIDTHIHPTNVFGDYDAAPKYLGEDSVDFLRKKLSDTYLPYGVTAVMIMGQPEAWLKPVLKWSAEPSAKYTDIYTVGGALISREERKTYISHITVETPAAARSKIIEYYKKGIRHIKLYSRLRDAEFKAAFATADSLGMKVYGHVDNGVMVMDSTMAIGLTNYEHIFTIMRSLPFTQADWVKLDTWMESFYGKGKLSSLSFMEEVMNEAGFTFANKLPAFDSLVGRLVDNHASISTTIHLGAEKLGQAYFSNPGNMPDPNWTPERVKRNADNFKAFMFLAKRAHDKGIKIRLGTDCPQGGKAALSEQLLLYEYGFSIPAILQISTINGATALGMEDKYGSIEKGKQANLVIYEKSPFDNYRNFLSKRTVIKSGKVTPTAQ